MRRILAGVAIIGVIGVLVAGLVSGWVAAAVAAIGACMLFSVAYGTYYALGLAHNSPTYDSDTELPQVRTVGFGAFAFPRYAKPPREPRV